MLSYTAPATAHIKEGSGGNEGGGMGQAVEQHAKQRRGWKQQRDADASNVMSQEDIQAAVASTVTKVG
jgi:hypothetical protein